MARVIKASSVDHPIKIGRRFISKFGFSNVNVEKFDIFLIDNLLASNPDSDDPKDPTYKQFREERTRARGILNRVGPDMDEGQRFQITVLIPGRMYRVLPYGVAVLDSAANFGSQIQKMVDGKRARIRATQKRVQELTLYADGDQAELMEVQKILALCGDQTEGFSDRMKAETHKYIRGVDAAFKMADKLLAKYED